MANRTGKSRTHASPRRDAGFTMLELIVVIAVIAVLASIAVPLAMVFEDRARAEATEKEMYSLKDALVAWYEDHGGFPADLDSLSSGGYIDGGTDPIGYARDAWNNDYLYVPAGMSAALTSFGADRAVSTGDDIAMTVSGGVTARARTRDEMGTIHIALRNYESLRVPSSLPNLPAHWDRVGATDGAFQRLVAEGLLPDETRFLTDSWGATYGYAGTPADYVTSPNVGTGP